MRYERVWVLLVTLAGSVGCGTSTGVEASEETAAPAGAPWRWTFCPEQALVSRTGPVVGFDGQRWLATDRVNDIMRWQEGGVFVLATLGQESSEAEALFVLDACGTAVGARELNPATPLPRQSFNAVARTWEGGIAWGRPSIRVEPIDPSGLLLSSAGEIRRQVSVPEELGMAPLKVATGGLLTAFAVPTSPTSPPGGASAYDVDVYGDRHQFLYSRRLSSTGAIQVASVAVHDSGEVTVVAAASGPVDVGGSAEEGSAIWRLDEAGQVVASRPLDVPFASLVRNTFVWPAGEEVWFYGELAGVSEVDGPSFGDREGDGVVRFDSRLNAKLTVAISSGEAAFGEGAGNVSLDDAVVRGAGHDLVVLLRGSSADVNTFAVGAEQHQLTGFGRALVRVRADGSSCVSETRLRAIGLRGIDHVLGTTRIRAGGTFDSGFMTVENPTSESMTWIGQVTSECLVEPQDYR